MQIKLLVQSVLMASALLSVPAFGMDHYWTWSDMARVASDPRHACGAEDKTRWYRLQFNTSYCGQGPDFEPTFEMDEQDENCPIKVVSQLGVGLKCFVASLCLSPRCLKGRECGFGGAEADVDVSVFVWLWGDGGGGTMTNMLESGVEQPPDYTTYTSDFLVPANSAGNFSLLQKSTKKQSRKLAIWASDGLWDTATFTVEPEACDQVGQQTLCDLPVYRALVLGHDYTTSWPEDSDLQVAWACQDQQDTRTTSVYTQNKSGGHLDDSKLVQKSAFMDKAMYVGKDGFIDVKKVASIPPAVSIEFCLPPQVNSDWCKSKAQPQP
ncbi:hypothetical protein ACQY0O_001344 [Thecaphora frezii]